MFVRKASTFHSEQVALYENRDLQRRVLHHILRVDGDRYVMKGDSNAFVDRFEPDKADMVGTLWFSVGGVGTWGERLAKPAHAALVTGLAALVSPLAAASRRSDTGGAGARREPCTRTGTSPPASPRM